eukprot:scaffold150_cov204-Pinguiococcus_pyrenoidosus.AAC.4
MVKARASPSTPSATSSPRPVSQADSTTSGDCSFSSMLATACAVSTALSWDEPHKAIPLRPPTWGSTKPCVARWITPVDAAIRRCTSMSVACSPVRTSSLFTPKIPATVWASSSA